MATLEDFRLAASQAARIALFGPVSTVKPYTTQHGLLRSQTARTDLLLPGAKRYQIRVSPQEQDGTDSNAVYSVADVEIEVHHCLLLREVADAENLYRTDEMLWNQGRLLSEATWRALASVDEVLEGPLMSSDPERDGDVISYTVSLSVKIPN
jgi:hypothetical protein